MSIRDQMVEPRTQGYPLWDASCGVWRDAAGNERPAMPATERKNEQRRRRRGAAAFERDRDTAYAAEFFGLNVRIPWDGWGGVYANYDDWSVGTVSDYSARTKLFTVHFDPTLEWTDIGLT